MNSVWRRWQSAPWCLLRRQQVDLPGPLSGVKDGDLVDSTTVTVREALPVRDHFSPAREHDSRPLTIDESRRGCGLLAALGDASIARLRACEAHDVRFVLRLKDHWKPKVDYLVRGQVTGEFISGTDLDALIEEEILILDGRAIDADGHIGAAKQPLHLGLVGVQTPKGYCFFLTNLPPRLGPLQGEVSRTEAPLHPRRLALPLAVSC